MVTGDTSSPNEDSGGDVRKGVYRNPADGQEVPMEEAVSLVHKAGEPVVTGSSPREILVDWANGQDAWSRQLTSEVLSAGAAPSTQLADELYEMFKAEKGLNNQPIPNVPLLTIAEDEAGVEEELVLHKLHSVKGVNALADGHEIHFNRGLTVLYGENGTGKTGYARVLKRAAGVRTAEQILSNAHAVDKQPPPSATIEYQVGTEAVSVEWTNEEGLPPFTRISVFDNSAVSLHIDEELNYVFTPADLALFTHVTAGVRAVQERASSEAAELHSGGNPFLGRFARGSTIYPVIESLGPATDLSELSDLAVVPEDAETQRTTLNEEIGALKGNIVDERIVASQQQVQSLTQLVALLDKVSAFDCPAYETARQAVSRLEVALRKARGELFEPGELVGNADDEWHSFVSSADRYRDHLHLDDYPSTGDRCLYCGQTLEDSSRVLVSKYRTFLDDTLATELAEARASLDRAVLRINEQQIELTSTYLGQLSKATTVRTWHPAAAAVVQSSTLLVQRSADAQEITKAEVPSEVAATIDLIQRDVDELKRRIVELEEARGDRASKLAQRQAQLLELEAKLELNRVLPDIRTFVTNAKRSLRLDQYAKRISSTTLRSLTDASKVASEELINRNFERFFAEECVALRAPSVRLEFHGRAGHAERKKSVATRKPSAILSEGECKVLALADFLAECRLRDARAPIVFDDPVSSLDYRRMREVSQRIAKLTTSHQVIVFTHNLWLTTGLLSQFEKRKDECSYYTVRDHGDAKGLVSAEAGPRQDSPKEIGKKIRQLIEGAKKADPTVSEALAEKGYEHIRSWCEAFVEQDLLQGVTQRYQPNVMMTKLTQIRPDQIPKASAVIDPIFDKACRYMGGHSQPLEQLHVRPTISELEADFETLEKFRSTFLAD